MKLAFLGAAALTSLSLLGGTAQAETPTKLGIGMILATGSRGRLGCHAAA